MSLIWKRILEAFVFSSLVMAGLSGLTKEPEVSVGLASGAVPPGQHFNLTIQVKVDVSQGEVPTERPEWKPPAGVILHGTQDQTVMESHLQAGPNGMDFQKNRVTKYIFELSIEREGTYTLGPFTCKVGGRSIKAASVPIKVSVKAPKTAQSRSRGRFLSPFFDEEDEGLWSQMLGQRPIPTEEPPILDRKLPVDVKDPFFVTLEADKTDVYQGEQVFASWYIYTRGNIHQFDRLKFPDFKGFWKEDVEPAPNLNFMKEMVNGVLFHRALLASYAIFPINAGTAVIDEYKIRAAISLPQPFGGMGFAQPESYTKSSLPLTLNVKPLPQEGKPAHFTGGVGQFQVKAYIDQQKMIQWQPITLKLRFEGDGNAKLIELPSIKWPSQFELYDVKSESRFFQSGKSFKEFTLLVIPKESGVLRIPRFEFSTFNPVTKVYETIETQEIALQIAPGLAPIAHSERVKVKPQEETPTMTPIRLPPPQRPKGHRTWQWLTGLPMLFSWTALYALLFLGFVLFHWLWLRRLYRSKTLWDELYERQEESIQCIESKDLPKGAAEIINAIYFILSHLVDQGGFTKDVSQLMDQLPPSIRAEVSQPLKNHLEWFQVIAFAPSEAWAQDQNFETSKIKAKESFALLKRALSLSEEGVRA